MLAGAQARQFLPAALANPQRTPANAQRIRVVEDDELVIRGQPQVALDARAKLKRRSECDQAILGKSGAIMDAAMGETPRTGVERVRL